MLGATLWVGLLVAAGYLFGNIPWIKHNLGMMTLGIIVVSLLPAAWGWWRSRRQATVA
jgi:membrane-associated protein